jgi:hypothetical protein
MKLLMNFSISGEILQTNCTETSSHVSARNFCCKFKLLKLDYSLFYSHMEENLFLDYSLYLSYE